MGLNDAERIWMNLGYILNISALSPSNIRYMSILTHITHNNSVNYGGRGDLEGYG